MLRGKAFELPLSINGTEAFCSRAALYGGIPIWALAQRNGMRGRDLFLGRFGSRSWRTAAQLLRAIRRQDAEQTRVAQVISWLRLPPAQRPHLVAVSSPCEFAAVQGALGDKDAAFRSLDQCYEDRSWEIIFLKLDTAFAELRGDPRYDAMVHRLTL